MKRYLSLLVIGLVAGSMWAADMPKQGFGFHIGYAQPTLRLNSLSNPESAKDSLSVNIQLLGCKVGVVYDGSIIKGFGTSIGVNYTFGQYNSVSSAIIRAAVRLFVTTRWSCLSIGSISSRWRKRRT